MSAHYNNYLFFSPLSSFFDPQLSFICFGLSSTSLWPLLCFTHLLCLLSLLLHSVCCVLKPQWRPRPPPSCRLLLSSLSQASWLEFRRPVSGFELHCCADHLKLSNNAETTVRDQTRILYIFVLWLSIDTHAVVLILFLILLSSCVSFCIHKACECTQNKSSFVFLLLELLDYSCTLLCMDRLAWHFYT